MSNMDFTYDKKVSSGTYLVVGHGRLTYNIATNWDNHTFTATAIQIYNDTDSKATFSYSVSFGGSTVVSGSVTLAASAVTTKTISGSKVVKRGHTNTVTSIGVTGSGAGGSASDSQTWNIASRPSYQVNYVANGGSNAPSAQTKWYMEDLRLSSSKPYRNGYEFWHWNTQTNNSGTTYQPGDTYTGNGTLYLYAIWNATITYNANASNVGSMPTGQTKTYGTAINISSTVPQRDGYQFLYWTTSANGTGTTYQSGQSYTGEVALTLYAQWRKVADPPTISSVTAIRCDSSRNADDMGTYCLVTAEWSVDTTSAGMATNQGTVTGTITPLGGTARTFTFDSSGSSGTSGTATALVANCDTDTTYTVAVRVTNTVIGTGQSSRLYTVATDILTSSHFLLDFRAGGNAVGLGVAAPQSGFEVGWATKFDDDVTIVGDMSANNFKQEYYSQADVFTPTSGWTRYAQTCAYKFGRLCLLTLLVSSTSAVAADLSAHTVGHLQSDVLPKSYVTFAFRYGTGGISTGSVVTIYPSSPIPANTQFYIGVAYYSP